MIHTIGFTATTAAAFFGRLRDAGIRRLIDVRLHNTSQLAGFAKRDDLAFFLRELCGADYVHEPRLAPSEDLFRFVKKERGDWAEYARRYLALLAERRVETALDPRRFLVPTVLLCSEASADRCHRRLAAEYLSHAWDGHEIVHL